MTTMREGEYEQDPGFTISPARYAKRQMAVSCASNGSGFKTRAMRLCCALNGRYSSRERSYMMSATKAAKLQRLYDEGYDATTMSQRLIAPDEIFPGIKRAVTDNSERA